MNIHMVLPVSSQEKRLRYFINKWKNKKQILYIMDWYAYKMIIWKIDRHMKLFLSKLSGNYLYTNI